MANGRRFAVLVCEDAVKWGGEKVVGDRFTNLLKWASDVEWCTFNACVGNLPAEEEISRYHGYVISGSHHSVNDDKEWIRKVEGLIRSIAKKSPSPRMVGVCFGHQLLAKALGGTVGPNPSGKFCLQSEEVRANHNITMDRGASRVFENGAVRLLESHSECVTKLPPGAVNLAQSSSCDHEVILFTDRILGVQAHPEVLPEEFEEKVLPSLVNARLYTNDDKVKVQESFKLPLNSEEVNHMLSEFLHR